MSENSKIPEKSSTKKRALCTRGAADATEVQEGTKQKLLSAEGEGGGHEVQTFEFSALSL